MASPSDRRDHWPVALAILHFAHTLWYGRLYPDGIYDPDLLAYFVYWKNLVTGTTSLHGASYFTVPKPLSVFLLGPLGSAPAAFGLSAVCAAGFGVLVYLIGRRLFGRATGVLCSIAVLLDIDRATLTAHSSADFFLTLFLFGSIYATLTRRYALSGSALLLAALAKPVALPCLLHLLAVDEPDRKRARLAALIPLLAIPLGLLSNQLLLGSPMGSERFFAEFAAMSEGSPMPASDLLRFVLWVELAKTIFIATAPFGVLGLVVWIGRDPRRLTNPFFLVPICFLLGYLAMSITTPFVAFARFFWPLQVWFGCFVVFGIMETARRLTPGRPRLRMGLAAGLLFFLLDGQMARQLHYRGHFAEPFQETMEFVASTAPLLTTERAAGETILAPLAFLPYLLWTLDDARQHPELVRTAEAFAQSASPQPPDWILYVPKIAIGAKTVEAENALLATGLYKPLMVSDEAPGALYVRADRTQPLARADAPR